MHPFFSFPHSDPVVLGHRGAAGHAPENTLLSFREALAQGADVIETDVHLCRDGVPVLIHDASVERTTQTSGGISDLRWEELRSLDAGFHTRIENDDATPFRGCNHRIPSLEEAFEAFPEARFNIELKTGGSALSERCVATVQAFGREDRTLLTAGDDLQMRSLRSAVAAQDVHVALGACTSEAAAFARAGAGDAQTALPEGVMALQVPAAFGEHPLVTPAFVAFAHTHGVAVHVWTIDCEDEMERLLALGADGLVTNYPDRMCAVLARRASREA